MSWGGYFFGFYPPFQAKYGIQTDDFVTFILGDRIIRKIEILSINSNQALTFDVIQPIHRFKSPNWLKKLRSHDMVYFQQCSCLETNPCVLFFAISMTLREAVTTAEFGTQ